ncbi:MAG: hypothetical protein N3D19_02745 [Archaeoglobaceae archaeon]|nr:hypothetical protein [Archaeoglobaceae archaeon]MDW8013336.1 hypothetical protein [Archaeoglobaceae archaeon]
MSEVLRALMKVLPKEFEEPFKHLIKAKIEYLKALKTFIETTIKNLEKFVEEEPKREKVKIE